MSGETTKRVFLPDPDVVGIPKSLLINTNSDAPEEKKRCLVTDVLCSESPTSNVKAPSTSNAVVNAVKEFLPQIKAANEELREGESVQNGIEIFSMTDEKEQKARLGYRSHKESDSESELSDNKDMSSLIEMDLAFYTNKTDTSACEDSSSIEASFGESSRESTPLGFKDDSSSGDSDSSPSHTMQALIEEIGSRP